LTPEQKRNSKEMSDLIWQARVVWGRIMRIREGMTNFDVLTDERIAVLKEADDICRKYWDVLKDFCSAVKQYEVGSDKHEVSEITVGNQNVKYYGTFQYIAIPLFANNVPIVSKPIFNVV
jgi:hypothetical protein